MVIEKDAFTLYLAPWQIRMAKDFLKRKVLRFNKMKIKPGLIKCPASYKIPVRGLRPGDWVMYLTDEQMMIVKQKLNLTTSVSGVNITNELLENQSVVFYA